MQTGKNEYKGNQGPKKGGGSLEKANGAGFIKFQFFFSMEILGRYKK
jgi:hypothetical protein